MTPFSLIDTTYDGIHKKLSQRYQSREKNRKKERKKERKTDRQTELHVQDVLHTRTTIEFLRFPQ